jgi:uncharacterized protein
MKPIKVPVETARKVALAAQLLDRSQEDTLAAIKHLGYVQIDSIHVIERAHHHTLWSRVPTYTPSILEDLLEKKRVFEYWAHAMSYIPMEDYRFYVKKMQDITSPWRKKMDDETREVQKHVLDVITKEGAKKSADFKRDTRGGTWWDWKPEKRALEILFDKGLLMVSRRERFQRVYDLTSRVLPDWVDVTAPTDRERARFFIERALAAHGLATEKEILTHIDSGDKSMLVAELARMVKSGKVREIQVGDLKDVYYVFEENLGAIGGVSYIEKTQKDNSKNIHILSPFDNFVIQRKRLQKLFDFKYTIECYVPAKKRIYGYFCLPVLFGTQFVARIDCKADRKSKTLLVKSVHYESELPCSKKELNVQLRKRLEDFASFNLCDSVEF